MGLKIEKDLSIWKSLQKDFQTINNKLIDYGFVNPRQQYENGINVAQNAQWQNEGTKNIPKRPFLTDATKTVKTAAFDAKLKSLMHKFVVKRYSASDLLDNTGKLLKETVKHKIKINNYKRNSPATISKKGWDEPLIETTKMLDSVDYVVKSR